jgi:hypothetical protein
MAAQIFLHPASQQRHLLETVSNLRSRNYVIFDQPGSRFVRAIPMGMDEITDNQMRVGFRKLFGVKS